LLAVAAAAAAAVVLYFSWRQSAPRCAVCGAKSMPLRQKKIIPSEYRKHLPEELKKHRPADVVRLCLRCHYYSEKRDDRLKSCLALAFSAPRGNRQSARSAQFGAALSAAAALKRHGERLPPERAAELQRLTAAAGSRADDRQEDVRHGARVVRALLGRRGAESLADFERLWRCHFEATMRPRFMPRDWGVG
ncbi:hypothetical protein BOX15_Mlig017757g1, partial [Macrostomum lignano]